MGRLKPGHLVEALLWLTLIVVLFIYSFEFNKEIEIYKYGAASWPRAILLLMALATIGQLVNQYLKGDVASSSALATASDDSMDSSAHTGLRWYASTFFLLTLPFIYMRLPEQLATMLSIGEDGIPQLKIFCALILFLLYLAFTWRNQVGGILALPILFAAMLEDMGFYALAPVFIIGVILLFGERRLSRMAMIMPLIYGLLLFFFVNLLYVGLPTGNIHPFYDLGNWVVKLLQ